MFSMICASALAKRSAVSAPVVATTTPPGSNLPTGKACCPINSRGVTPFAAVMPLISLRTQPISGPCSRPALSGAMAASGTDLTAPRDHARRRRHGPSRRRPRRRRADPVVRTPDGTDPASHRRPAKLSRQGKHTYLTAGRRPALLPPRLATLLQDLATKPEPQRRLSVHADRRAAQWLFPGLVPGQPIANHALTTRLSRHDINVRIARNGALAALAADARPGRPSRHAHQHRRPMGQICRTRLGRLHSSPCH